MVSKESMNGLRTDLSYKVKHTLNLTMKIAALHALQNLLGDDLSDVIQNKENGLVMAVHSLNRHAELRDLKPVLDGLDKMPAHEVWIEMFQYCKEIAEKR